MCKGRKADGNSISELVAPRLLNCRGGVLHSQIRVTVLFRNYRFLIVKQKVLYCETKGFPV